ncbi:MAG: TetR family transcriptional regulator [Pseudomonadota bacterium]
MRSTRTTTRSTAFGAKPGRKPGVRELAAQATRDSLLRAAIKVFSRYGLGGGSVEKISKAAKSYDRMIYYYFGSKEGLFVAALEEIYRRFNEAESALRLDVEHPVESLMTLVSFVLTYYRDNPEFVTLLNSENLHRGKHISKSLRAREYSSPAIDAIGQVLRSGVAKGLFRDDVAARDVYLMIAAMGYFYQSNRFTLSAFLGENLEDPAAFAHWESFVKDAVLRTVSPREPATLGPSLPQDIQDRLTTEA